MNHGLIPGEVSLRTGRQVVFFTVVNPMDNQDGLGDTPCGLSQARIAPYKNTWKYFQGTVFWCNLKLAQQRGLQFYKTRSNAVLLYDTLPAEFIEKAVCVRTLEELYQKVRQTRRFPRVVLKSNSQCGQQDLRSQDARSSCDPPSDSKSYGETWNNASDYIILGIPISIVEQQDTTRENKVKKLIEKFESQQHKESFLQDLSQTQKINEFSKESQDLIADMNNTEIFEFCENSSNK